MSFTAFRQSQVVNGQSYTYRNHNGDETVIVFDGQSYSGVATLEQAEAFFYASAESNESKAVFQYDAFTDHFPDYDDVPPVLRGFTPACDSYMCPQVRLTFGDYTADILCDYRNADRREVKEGAQFVLSVSVGDAEVFQKEYDLLNDDVTQEAMTAIYAHYCDKQGLPEECAMELICGELTAEQRAWVSLYIVAWDDIVEGGKLWDNSFSKYGHNHDGVRELVRVGGLSKEEADHLDAMLIGDIYVDSDGDSWARSY